MSANKLLKINVLPAGRGLVWLTQSLRLIRSQPSRLLFLALLLQLILGLTRLPLIGVIVIMAMPALSAGLLQAFYLAASGQTPTSNILFTPLFSGARTGRLLGLGLLTTGCGSKTSHLETGGINATDLLNNLLDKTNRISTKCLNIYVW